MISSFDTYVSKIKARAGPARGASGREAHGPWHAGPLLQVVDDASYLADPVAEALQPVTFRGAGHWPSRSKASRTATSLRRTSALAIGDGCGSSEGIG